MLPLVTSGGKTSRVTKRAPVQKANYQTGFAWRGTQREPRIPRRTDAACRYKAAGSLRVAATHETRSRPRFSRSLCMRGFADNQHATAGRFQTLPAFPATCGHYQTTPTTFLQAHHQTYLQAHRQRTAKPAARHTANARPNPPPDTRPSIVATTPSVPNGAGGCQHHQECTRCSGVSLLLPGNALGANVWQNAASGCGASIAASKVKSRLSKTNGFVRTAPKLKQLPNWSRMPAARVSATRTMSLKATFFAALEFAGRKFPAKPWSWGCTSLTQRGSSCWTSALPLSSV